MFNRSKLGLLNIRYCLQNIISNNLSKGLSNNLKLNGTEHGYFNSTSKSIQHQLCPKSPVIFISRNTSFFNKKDAQQLWKGVTSVSNAGKKRGRGKGNRRIFTKDLNRGQFIGKGEQNVVWPGLNAPILRGKEIVKQEMLPKDELRSQKLNELRDKMGVFRPMALNPLERGWSGNKLPGRKIGPPDPIGDDHFIGFETIVLETKTVTKMDGIMGRKRRISMFVVTGNQNGLGGFALTKANSIQNAIRKCKNLAGQKLIYIERCENHTVFHDFFCQFLSTKIFVKRKPEGYGLVCHRGIKAICEIIGIKNLHAKIEGSTNIQKITKAFFLGLLNQRTHQQLAEEKGLYVAKVRPGTYPQVVASPQNKPLRSRHEIPMDEEMDFKLYTMDGKVEVERKKFIPFYQALPSYERHLKKQVKCRNHEKIKNQLSVQNGDVRSFYAEKYPECVAHSWTQPFET